MYSASYFSKRCFVRLCFDWYHPRPAFLLALAVLPLLGTERRRAVQRTGPFNSQDYQRPQVCMPCHQRQYDELRSSVKSGYRNVSPLFNGLEASANFLNGGLLRPVYATSTKTITLGNGSIIPFNTNMFTTPVFQNINQIRAGFCLGCHNGPYLTQGEGGTTHEVPELAGTGTSFVPEIFRPLRDYHLVDSERQSDPSRRRSAAILRPVPALRRAPRESPAICATTCKAPTWSGAYKATGTPITVTFSTTPSRR